MRVHMQHPAWHVRERKRVCVCEEKSKKKAENERAQYLCTEKLSWTIFVSFVAVAECDCWWSCCLAGLFFPKRFKSDGESQIGVTRTVSGRSQQDSDEELTVNVLPPWPSFRQFHYFSYVFISSLILFRRFPRYVHVLLLLLLLLLLSLLYLLSLNLYLLSLWFRRYDCDNFINIHRDVYYILHYAYNTGISVSIFVYMCIYM